MNVELYVINMVAVCIINVAFILYSFPWLCGAYGLVGPNKKIPRPHIYLTVKKGMEESDVRRELEKKFKCDAKEHFELLEEPERKPKFQYLGKCVSKSTGKWPVSSSVQPAPGCGVLAGSKRSYTNQNHLRVPEENERDDLPDFYGTGTLTMFCALNGQHYALTCFHVGCTTDEHRSNAAFNKVADIQKMRTQLPSYVRYAKKQQYFFTNDKAEDDNGPILFGDDGRNYTHLGDFDNYRFDNECDILSLKISEGTEIDCKIADATSPDWDSLWDELFESTDHPMEVTKIGFSSALTRGYLVPCDFSYSEEQKPLFQDAFAVKGCGGPFLKGGDSGSLVFFYDKNNQKQVFAYGVCEVDDLPLPEQHESTSSASHEKALPEQPTGSVNDDGIGTWNKEGSSCSFEVVFQDESESNISRKEMEREERNSNNNVKTTGPYFICFRLDTALENLGLQGAACYHNCGCN